MNKILIVDDNRDNLELHRLLLAEAGFQVQTASSGGDALKILERDDTIEAVILDLSMPVLDGLTVAEQIRLNEGLHQDKTPVKIAFLTARRIDGAIKRIADRTNVERIFEKTGGGETLPGDVKEWLDD